jgi:protein-L-isoaspartate O-methyltransferase
MQTRPFEASGPVEKFSFIIITASKIHILSTLHRTLHVGGIIIIFMCKRITPLLNYTWKRTWSSGHGN